MRTGAIRIAETGGPDVLRWEEIDIGEPGAGQVLIRQTAIGLNFIDVYQRAGAYALALPFIPGNEGAGVVEAIGAGVTAVAPGDRVAYAMVPGAYAQHRLIAADRLVVLPADIDDRVAAAAMLKGMTAEYLLRRTYKVRAGETVLIHAAAGGVGLIACQWAASLGAVVIGTVGGAAKADLARAYGCHHVIDYRTEDFVARVKEITGGAGVDVVYDSVGKDTFPGSLDCLKVRGMWVSFGQSSGHVPPFTTQMLSQRGSLYATRPTLAHYVAIREELLDSASALFAMIRSGAVRIAIGQTWPLNEASQAHIALEARATTGASVLVA